MEKNGVSTQVLLWLPGGLTGEMPKVAKMPKIVESLRSFFLYKRSIYLGDIKIDRIPPRLSAFFLAD